MVRFPFRDLTCPLILLGGTYLRDSVPVPPTLLTQLVLHWVEVNEPPRTVTRLDCNVMEDKRLLGILPPR